MNYYSASARRRRARKVYRFRRRHRPPHSGQRGIGRKCWSRGLGHNIK